MMLLALFTDDDDVVVYQLVEAHQSRVDRIPRQPLRGGRGRDRTLDGGGPVGGRGHKRVHHVGPIVREPDNNQ
jgi:hypothetical protein